jgi:hypothetical protein
MEFLQREELAMATLSTDAPTTPLRQRMQQDMLMRGLGSHTQQDYVRHVRRFAVFLGRAPDTATTEDIRRFQLRQHESGVGPATINGAVSALRFLFTVTLKRRDLARALVITRYPRKLPEVLSVEEAARLLEAAPGIKYKAALGAAYGAGLRVSEVTHLKVDDIDSTAQCTPSASNPFFIVPTALTTPLAICPGGQLGANKSTRKADKSRGCARRARGSLHSPLAFMLVLSSRHFNFHGMARLESRRVHRSALRIR